MNLVRLAKSWLVGSIVIALVAITLLIFDGSRRRFAGPSVSFVAAGYLVVTAVAAVTVATATARPLSRIRPTVIRWSECETCGYDVRASVDRCPECGTPLEAVSR